MDNTKEYITCAAIHVQDFCKYMHQPINIESGIVICGHRHGCCYISFINMKYPEKHGFKITQGFMTSYNRFVNRDEAAIISKAVGQCNENACLFSENLY